MSEFEGIAFKCLKPTLKFFIGADIIGSTALKQSQNNFDEDDDKERKVVRWFDVIRDFYRVSQYEFISKWVEKKSSSSNKDSHYGPDPVLWKTIGDEVIFVKDITDHRQITTIINSWKESVVKINDFFVQKNLPNLRVKCVCWTAGFPILNREIAIQSNDGQAPPPSPEEAEKINYELLEKFYSGENKNIIIDYIGPSIDTGFRLSNQATKRKLVVSIDVAYFIAATRKEDGIELLELYYDGAMQLKGVTGGNEYPIFWISVGNEEIYKQEDKLMKNDSVDLRVVENYCGEYYSSREKFTFRPFISDEHATLGTCPPWYLKRLMNIQANITIPDAIDAQESSSCDTGGEEITSETIGKMTE